MKATLLLFILILYTKITLCQVEKSSVSILENIIRKNQSQRIIIYADKVDKNILTKHFQALSKRKIKGISRDTESNFIKLTKKERKYLIKRLTICMSSFWGDSLFTNSKRILLDSAFIYIQNKKREARALVNNSNNIDSIKTNTSGYNWQYAVFQFSDIIYLRNNSIFLNYCMWNDGSGGTESLYFYKNDNGTWRKWILVSAGDW